jgi:hypothetical protein
MIRTVVGSFDNLANAYQVVGALRAAGFMESDMNVVGNEAAAAAVDMTMPEARTGNGATTGAVAGSALGGAAGLWFSLLGLAIPGIGPILVAGPLAAALVGAGAGAVAGGLLGGLTDLGISQSDAESYAEMIRRGGAIVTLRADESRVEEAEEIMRKSGAVDMRDRIVHWEDSGWRGYDPDASPFTAAQMDDDRKRSADRHAREAAEASLRR